MKNNQLDRFALAYSCLAAAVLAGCGGSSGDSATPAPAPAPAPAAVVFSGTAATGAPLSGATIKVVDKTGASVCTATAGGDGSYTCTLQSGAAAPFVLSASLDGLSLYSAYADATTTTLNITPLTSVLASRLSSNGDPAQLAADIQGTSSRLTSDALTQAVADLTAALKPLFDAVGTTTNPLTGSFSANGTGMDKVLDNLLVNIRPAGGSANIDITVKSAPPADGAAPPQISFKSSDTSLPTLPATITAGALAPDNIAAMVDALLAKLTACYALAPAQRVTNGEIAAGPCRDMFHNSDPSLYLSNGSTVGPSGSFSGVFNANVQNVAWGSGRLEFLRTNGDVVLSYRRVDAAGNPTWDTLAARPSNGVLGLIGNQYQYSTSVTPHLQHRDFINTPAYTYLSVGYVVNVANRQSNGSPVFAKVEVTSPDGTKFTFVPSAGRANLVLLKADGSTSSTSFIRYAAQYTNPGMAGNPSDKETGLVFLPTQFTDAQLVALGDHGTWTIEYFHVDTSVANVIERRTTVSRAPSIAEAAQLVYADLTTAMRQEVAAGSSATGYFIFGTAGSASAPNVVDFSADGNLDAWTVPSSAIAPTSVIAYGRAPAVNGVPGNSWDDGVTILPSARKAIVSCSKQSNADLHCDSTYPTQYAQGSTVNSVELYALSPRIVGVSKMIAVYKLQ